MSTGTQLLGTKRTAAASRDLPTWPPLLLACGVVSSLLWVCSDVIASLLYDGYSYKDQTVSELSAFGADTRSWMIPAVIVFGLLTLAFAVGIWREGHGNRAMRAIAVILVLNSVINIVLTPFTSMHTREVLAADGGTTTDTLHLITAMVNVLAFFTAMAIGSTAFGKRFRVYTLVTVAVLLVFGGFSALDAPDVAANEPTPWLGITERISAYAWMLWVAVLAATLLLRGRVIREETNR